MPALLIDCPSCGRKLRIPEELLGKAVKCPTCDHTFQAAAAPVHTELPAADAAASLPLAGDSAPIPSHFEDQQPLERDAHSWTCPSCGASNHSDAARCGSCGKELEDEEDDRPWDDQRHFEGRRDAEPHRGTLILVLGIVSIVMVVLCGPVGLPMGIAAWVMGRRDLTKMRQSMMDREGEGLTQAGWICGIIGTILNSLWVIGCLAYMGFVFTVVAGARRAPVPPMPAPVPAPVRPAPIPGPGPVGNRAAFLDGPQRLLDHPAAPRS